MTRGTHARVGERERDKNWVRGEMSFGPSGREKGSWAGEKGNGLEREIRPKIGNENFKYFLNYRNTRKPERLLKNK